MIGVCITQSIKRGLRSVYCIQKCRLKDDDEKRYHIIV